MVLTLEKGAIKKFRRIPWKFQQTFHTPLHNLVPFVETIVDAAGPAQSSTVVIDEIVFDPENLLALLPCGGAGNHLTHDSSFLGSSKIETQELLLAAFGDWVDFIFLPIPKPFVIYADHDEFTTFYANSKSNLNRVALPLLERGFKDVGGYERKLIKSNNPW